MRSFETRHATREALHDVTVRLIADFTDVPAGTVINCVGRARENLLRVGVRDDLVPATESMARSWLSSVSSAHAG